MVLCSCTQAENTDTQFLLDTVITLSADCSDQTLAGAFSLCKKKEDELSTTKEGSDVWRINHTEGEVKVSKETEKIIKKSIYYGNLSGGKFDISVYPLSSLWDFKNEVIPSRNEIAEALKNIDYQEIKTENQTVSGNKKIDLGGIAKGYIADCLLEYFKEQNTKTGILNVGGSIVTFGEKDYVVGIKEPFSDNGISAELKLRNKAVVTAGVYERCFEKNGVLYHHILDVSTGYPVESDLLSATVICNSSVDGDALSTICILSGLNKAKELIESQNGFEAIFIDKNKNLSYTSGLIKKGNYFVLK